MRLHANYSTSSILPSFVWESIGGSGVAQVTWVYLWYAHFRLIIPIYSITLIPAGHHPDTSHVLIAQIVVVISLTIHHWVLNSLFHPPDTTIQISGQTNPTLFGFVLVLNHNGSQVVLLLITDRTNNGHYFYKEEDECKWL